MALVSPVAVEIFCFNIRQVIRTKYVNRDNRYQHVRAFTLLHSNISNYPSADL